MCKRRTLASGTIRAPHRQASARWARSPDCFAPDLQPNGHEPQSPQPTPSRRVSPAANPRAAAPRRIAASFGGTFGGAVTPSSRSMTARSSSVSGPSMPASPWCIAQAWRTPSGGRMQVIQLTVVPPPTEPPARMATDPSHDETSPWSRYRRSNASSSFVGISGSGTNGPASRTTTDRPARDSSAAMTPPPAPEPTMTTSASSSNARSAGSVVGTRVGRDGTAAGPHRVGGAVPGYGAASASASRDKSNGQIGVGSLVTGSKAGA